MVLALSSAPQWNGSAPTVPSISGGSGSGRGAVMAGPTRVLEMSRRVRLAHPRWLLYLAHLPSWEAWHVWPQQHSGAAHAPRRPRGRRYQAVAPMQHPPGLRLSIPAQALGTGQLPHINRCTPKGQQGPAACCGPSPRAPPLFHNAAWNVHTLEGCTRAAERSARLPPAPRAAQGPQRPWRALMGAVCTKETTVLETEVSPEGYCPRYDLQSVCRRER